VGPDRPLRRSGGGRARALRGVPRRRQDAGGLPQPRAAERRPRLR
jgi:hypothetical protein